MQALPQNGWVLLDFPASFAQAKLLEQALSGFVPAPEQERTEREAQAEEARLLVEPTAKEQPPRQLTRSGLDAVVWIDASREECMRRALGRRFDPVNEKVYHVEDQPPLTTNAPLCERLEPVDEQESAEATLVDRWLAFDRGAAGLEKWLAQFGVASKKGADFCVLNKVSGDQEPDAVFRDVKQVLDLVARKKAKQQLKLKKRILSRLIAAEEAEAERLRQLQ